ncbi:hypothetical protein CANCADRAFT_125676 [Tortispora caseinolytica NRRL Y-17796]|uniref:Uncharacterized protein n=1 Tax=Tortispora caseinolytica NRRL Y-17796 TaxID=767744 RepID=A0A1E4TA49_9ASCO|nr:hypothetical protein CANCADRAFT_125676 [Tortispora caseinolytica NRRL Y-17796]
MPILYRQNAMKRPVNQPVPQYMALKRKHEFWMLEQPQNLPPPEQPSVRSLYWKVPDSAEYLTSVAAHDEEPLFAVASGGDTQNLYVYEMEYSYENPGFSGLTHHQTITLPRIHSLCWLPRAKPNAFANVLATGNEAGIVNMVMLPDPHSNNPAEILRRFNHAHHVKASTGVNSRMSSVTLTTPDWVSAPNSSLITVYSDHLFLWDPTRSDRPVIKKHIHGSISADASQLRDGIVAAAGSYGVLLTDVRKKNPALLYPHDDNDTPAILVKWSPLNSDVMASTHSDGTIRVWDIRSSGPLTVLNTKSDRVNTIHWSKTNENELISGSADGSIQVWNTAIKPETVSRRSDRLSSGSSHESEYSWLSPAQRAARARRCAMFYSLSHKPSSTLAVNANLKSLISNELAKTNHAYIQRPQCVVGSVSLPESMHSSSFVTVTMDGHLALHYQPVSHELSHRDSMESVKSQSSLKTIDTVSMPATPEVSHSTYVPKSAKHEIAYQDESPTLPQITAFDDIAIPVVPESLPQLF